MPARWLSAPPRLMADLGRVALQRGLFIYCVEEADAGVDVGRLLVDARQPVEPGPASNALGDCRTLEARGWVASYLGWDDHLYRAGLPELVPITVRAIPYPLWAHRGSGSMPVWLRST
jgi:uncharacterized protein